MAFVARSRWSASSTKAGSHSKAIPALWGSAGCAQAVVRMLVTTLLALDLAALPRLPGPGRGQRVPSVRSRESATTIAYRASRHFLTSAIQEGLMMGTSTGITWWTLAPTMIPRI